MNIAAIVTDGADRHLVHPVQIEERRRLCIELYLVTPEIRIAADLATDRPAVNRHGSGFFVAENAFVPAEETPEYTHNTVRIHVPGSEYRETISVFYVSR